MEIANPTLIVALLALGGAVAAAGAQFWSAFVTAKPSGDNAVYQGFKGLVDGLQARVSGLETKVDACEARHEECEANLAKLRRELDEYLTEHPPATYRASDLRRPIEPKKKGPR